MTDHNVKIGDRVIGRGHPCYLIAEVGTTCLGDLENALKLVEAGAKAGVDAVKFQMIDPEQLSDTSVQYRVVVDGVEQMVNMKDMFRRLSFSDEQWGQIRDACRANNVDFFATVDHLSGVDRLERLGVPVHKMGAWDVTYRPLVEKMAVTGKPLFVDLGPATEAEADELVSWFKEAGGKVVMFMHDFHTTRAEQKNMRALTYLARKYPWPAGWSSPNREDDLDMVAITLGAAHMEKRLILDRGMKAFHAHESLEPDELAAWVQRIRQVERSLGQEAILPSDSDLETAVTAFRSVCTTRAVKVGEVFSLDNLDGKRPGTGISAKRLHEFWGRVATRDLPADTLINEADAR